MPTPDEIVTRIFRGLRPKEINKAPIGADEIRGLLRELAAAPPKDVVLALSKVEGEQIEKVHEWNNLRKLTELFLEHGDRAGRLAFAKCAALRGAQPPAGGDQPGAGAAAALAIGGDAELLEELKVEKGQFPQILVDGIYWNPVFTSKGKYGDPPPVHDCEAVTAWNAAVARSKNARLKAACVRAGTAALGRFPPVPRKSPERNAPDDPFGLKFAGADKERMRLAKRAPVEGLVKILESGADSSVVDEIRAGGKGELAKIVQVALETDDDLAFDALGRFVGAICPNVPAGATPDARASFLRTSCDERRAERLGFAAAALDRAFGELKADVKRKAAIYAKIAIASLGRKEGGHGFAIAMQKQGTGTGETVDPIVAALEQRFLEKAGAGAGGESSGSMKKPSGAAKKPLLGAKAKGKEKEPPPPPADPLARSAAADLFRPREPKPDGNTIAIGDKGLAETLGGGAFERWRAAFAKGFEAGSVLAVVGAGAT